MYFTLTLAVSFITNDNYINSDCEFDIIRLNKNQIKCIDSGVNKKYCNHYKFPNEIKITKERGIGLNDKFIFSPQAMYEEKDDKVYKMLDFKYSFYCDKNHNYPDLSVYLTPTKKYNKSSSEEFAEFIALLFIVIIIMVFCAMFGFLENNNHRNDGFWLGYILGSNNNNLRDRIYCE